MICFLVPEMWQLSKIVIPEIKANWKDVAYISLHYDISKVKSIEENTAMILKSAAKNSLRIGYAHAKRVNQKHGKYC